MYEHTGGKEDHVWLLPGRKKELFSHHNSPPSSQMKDWGWKIIIKCKMSRKHSTSEMLMKNNIKQKLITLPLFLMFFHKLNYEAGGTVRNVK